MKTPRILRACGAATGLALLATAPAFADQNLAGNVTITAGPSAGNLNVTGTIDNIGNSFFFGTQGSSYGGALLYNPSTGTDTFTFSINYTPGSWLWVHNTSVPAMRLDSSHNLLLYPTGATLNSTPASITLSPATSTAGATLSLGNATGASPTSGPSLSLGGATLTNQSGVLTTSGAFTVAGNLTTSTAAVTSFLGNVGIGTTNPGTRKLNVQSSDSSNDIGVEIGLGRTTGTNYGLGVSATGAGADLNQGIFTTARNGTSNWGLRIYNVLDTPTNYALYSDSPAQSYFQGKVGIGMLIPEAKLQVVGGNFFVNQVNDATGGLYYGNSYNGLVIGKYSTSPWPGTNGLFVGGNSLLMGNVAIGTTSTSAQLEVSKASTDATVKQEVVRVTTTGRSAGGGIADRSALVTFYDSANPTYTGALGGYRVNSNNDYNGGLQFYVNNTGASPNQSVTGLAEAMRITNAGNVGIGTVSPATALQVGTSFQADNGVGVWVNNQLNGGTKAAPADLYINYGSQGYDTYLQGTKVVVKSNGNIGIGTTSPQSYAALDVNTTGQKSIHTMDSANGGLIIGFGGPTIQARTTSDGNTANLILQSWGGNVGIGTNSPTHLLSVKGAIRAQEVIVDNSNWADYVFDSNYRLAPLSEVEQHIKAEKHLPGIPSAQEIAEHGVSMGDMQSKLLSKVEELTLHLIRMEKENAQLRQRVQTLEQSR